ncbi:MAG TPA: hypothetical protein VNM43_06170 [Dehalococcoidia bacterium]|nr:hypothetical protein [Dehalococcoidia bacterium]
MPVRHIRGMLIASGAVALMALAAPGDGGTRTAHATTWYAGTATVKLMPATRNLALGGTAAVDVLVQDVTTPAISIFGDGVDNDGDGRVDEDLVIGVDDDGDCPGDTNGDGHVCRVGDQRVDEDPVDGVDDDYKIGGGEGGAAPSNCFDGQDNDGDGLIDGDDPDCEGDNLADEDPPPGQTGSDDDKDGREGASSPLGTCDDQLDNDGDGLRDLADSNCAGKVDEDPVDGVDNDGDGRIDEDPRNEDRDGSEYGGRYPTNCADGLDNDGDGQRDDNDPDCAPYIDEDGGQDNDGDSRVDEDRRDDDRDGQTDEDGPMPCLVNPLNPFQGSVPCGLGAYELKITYDPTVVQFVSAENRTFLGSTGRTVYGCSTWTGVNSPTSAWVRFGCFTLGTPGNPASPPGPQGSGTLARMRFTGLAMGTTSLDISGTVLYDIASRPLNATLVSGTASVGRCADVPLPVHGLTHGVNDDGDAQTDEDPIDNVDNDGDGRKDEDPPYGVINGTIAVQDAQGVFAFWKTRQPYGSDYNGNGRQDGREYDVQPSSQDGAVTVLDAQYAFSVFGQSCPPTP